MGVLLKERKLLRKSIAIIAAFIFILSTVFGNVAGTAGEVYAGGRTGNLGIKEMYSDGDTSRYPTCVLDDSYLDANGNLTIEFQPLDNEYTLLFQDETLKKVYINKNFYAMVTEYAPIAYFIINGEKLVKNNGQSIVVNKADFKTDSQFFDSYGEGFSTITIDYVTSDVKGQWYKGFWFDANGENSYAPTGSWKGSGNSQWFEDTSGWYPTSQWMLTDKMYRPYEAYKYKSDALTTYSSAWSNDYMYVQKAWYYFDENGYAASNGWYKIDGYWYYFKDFLYESCCWRDGYYINSDGTQTYSATGSWKGNSSGWWYEDTSGWYPVNTSQVIDGETYYFKSNGYMACDEWIAPGESGSTNSDWIHVNSSGLQDKGGYYEENGKWQEYEVTY